MTQSPQGDAHSSEQRRVRFTVDMRRDQHRALKIFALDAGSDASVIVRTLLSLLEEDEALAQRVLDRLPKKR